MVGRRHHCRIDVLLFPVEQLAEIIVSPGLGKPLEARIVGVSNLWMVVTDSLMGSFLVDIANCNDIDTAQMSLQPSRIGHDFVDEKSPVTPGADECQVERFARSSVAGAAQHVSRNNRKRNR